VKTKAGAVLIAFTLSFIGAEGWLSGHQQPERGIRGRIVDVYGNPLAGAKVTCRDDAGVVGTSVEADDKGEYLVRGRRRQCSTVVAEMPGFKPAAQSTIDSSVLDLSLVAGSLGGSARTIRGTISHGKAPVANASVWLVLLGGEQVEGGRSDGQGRFALDVQAGGDMSICVRAVDARLAPECRAVSIAGAHAPEIAFELADRPH
jgi:hypothetical protein